MLGGYLGDIGPFYLRLPVYFIWMFPEFFCILNNSIPTIPMSCLCEKCWNTRSTELRACWGIILFLTKFISNKVNSQLETAKTRFAAHTFAAQDYGELFMFFLTPPTFFLHSTLQCWLTQTRTGVDIFPQNWSKVDRKQGYFCSEHLLFSLNCLQNIPPLVGTVGTQSGNLNQC